MFKPWVSWWSLPRGIAPGSHLPQTPPLQPLPTSVNLSAKNLGIGRKKLPDRYENFPKGENWISNPLGEKDGKRV